MTGLRAKLLVIDDEADYLAVLKDFLEHEGFSVVTASSANDAWLAAHDSSPDLVLCDVCLPGDSGVALCRKLKSDKKTSRIPILLMSAVNQGTTEQIEGISLGAEDYLAKPFSPALLAAKIRAVLRRSSPGAAPRERIKLDGLEIDADARLAFRGEKPLALTRKEFDLLTTFVRHPGQVLSVPYLIETVWGYDPADYNDPHTVGVHISSLRKKIGPRLAKRIVSVPALGYRFDAEGSGLNHRNQPG